MNQSLFIESMTDASLLDELEMHLNHQLELCDRLEEIADTLPNNIDNQRCLHAARSIYPTIKAAHDFEEKRIFPLLVKSLPCNNELKEIIERLHAEHWEDESFGQELEDALKAFVAGTEKNIDKLSYMLRGFFEGLRRHIAAEKQILSSRITRPIH